ncbi:clan AA aspartic protease [Sphingobacterium sp. SGG-5]|uniref:retropepsin-like aspartic protease n=1 Tax=Sphingobacterium sp. SGG-5 TaxID=2710881 RepID=UPI0013ED12E4|nr:retropepsin-like aspartic protease [Sphingobacterium sp. SGG-5]NGM62975.1 clan AA aspartic protease [Sphingobacterium sp. SGG-5]
MQNIPISVVNLQGDGYHILLEIEIFDRKFNMVLDTGASQTVLDRHTLIQSGIDELLLQSTDILSTGLGTNSMESHTLKLPYLKIDNWLQKNVVVAVLDLSTINYAYEKMNLPKVIGVLGSDIFVQYGAVINYKKKTLRLNTRKRRKTDR